METGGVVSNRIWRFSITGGMAFEVRRITLPLWYCGVYKKFALCDLCFILRALRAVHYLDIVARKESSSGEVVAFASVFWRRK